MSIYDGLSSHDKAQLTQALILKHPLNMGVVRDLVFEAWRLIIQGKFTDADGEVEDYFFDVKPESKDLCNQMHKKIPKLLAKEFGSKWREEVFKTDKDVVCTNDNKFSFEIKGGQGFDGKCSGNKSYANTKGNAAKSKNGFYLFFNFENIAEARAKGKRPEITFIRFGYVEQRNWRGQSSGSGQQATISPEVYKTQFMTLFDASKRNTTKEYIDNYLYKKPNVFSDTILERLTILDRKEFMPNLMVFQNKHESIQLAMI